MAHEPVHPAGQPQAPGHATFEPGHHPGHEHPDFLAHHWETPQQQFEAGKLGMWLFLATEVLLFGGLFCAYAVWRGNHPELFKFGSQFLDTTMGATNTVVLILSSLTMAWGVTAAQQNKRGLLILMLSLTLVGAATFMGIKYVEYSHKFHEGFYPGAKFYEKPAHSHTWQEPGAHGPMHGDAAAPQEHAAATQPAQPAGHAATSPAVQTARGPGTENLPPVEATSVPPPGHAPIGLASDAPLTAEPFKFEDRHHAALLHPLQDPHRPANAHMFFNIYFMMTGLHGIHVLVGMIVIVWLLVRAVKGHFSSEYFTPVDLGGLYWHIVDLIWIFLFPLFYLI